MYNEKVMSSGELNEMVSNLRRRLKPIRDILLSDIRDSYPGMTDEFGVMISWDEDDNLTVDVVLGNPKKWSGESLWDTGGVTGAGSTTSLADCLDALELRALRRAAALLNEKKYE